MDGAPVVVLEEVDGSVVGVSVVVVENVVTVVGGEVAGGSVVGDGVAVVDSATVGCVDVDDDTVEVGPSVVDELGKSLPLLSSSSESAWPVEASRFVGSALRSEMTATTVTAAMRPKATRRIVLEPRMRSATGCGARGGGGDACGGSLEGECGGGGGGDHEIRSGNP